jgi:hypothetical protein
MANLANGNTQTGGKFNARAVFAFHMESATWSLQNALIAQGGGLSGDIPKNDMRRAVENMRRTRVQAGIYRAGDFHEARLP